MEYIEGLFVEEEKSRFLCRVKVDGIEEKCYVPSSCKLGKLISLKGERVWLKPIKSEKTELRYSLYAVKKGRSWILLNLSEANSILGDQLQRKRFDFLGERQDLVYEKPVEKYKADVYLSNSRTIVEVKTVLTEERQGVFPGVSSKRTVSQLKQLSALLEKDYKACLMLMSLNPCTKSIRFTEDIKGYVQDSVDKGMICKGYSIRFRNRKPIIGDEVEIIL